MTRLLLLFPLLATVELLAAVEWVDPFIGTSAKTNGHAFPGAACPHGLVQASPDTGTGDWEHCAGYLYEDPAILGFSHTHFCGTGGADLGDVLLLPFTGDDVELRGLKNPADEKASPGYYAVSLTNYGVRAEISATPRTAIHRWRFPSGCSAKVLVDLQHGIVRHPYLLTNRVTAAACTFGADGRSLRGFNQVSAWLQRKVCFALVFDRPIVARRRLPPREGEMAARYVLEFGVPVGGRLCAKVGISVNSVEAAERALAVESPDWDFETVRDRAQAQWERELSRMVVVEASADKRQVFYSALYRFFLQPNDLSDVGMPAEYSGYSFWDTFRAAFPLQTIIAPEMMAGYVDSLMRLQRRQGFMPVMPFFGCEACSMIGNHSIPVVVDAFLKGIAGPVDEMELLVAVTNSLTVLHPGKPKEDWPLLDRYGYYPLDMVPNQSASRTLEASYDDACAARLCMALGAKEAAGRFERRANGWTNLFDRTQMLMRAKDSYGRWREPFDPFRTGYIENDFTEGNSWQYTWHVLQDVPGLVRAFGGAAVFADRLDRLFHLPEASEASGRIRDATGLIGQYPHGNEPAHHAAYLFTLVDRPERTAELVREIVDRFYTVGPAGICGNEDCGQMSAWYLFACLGFYPVDPCGGTFVLGAPQARRVEVRLPHGRTLTVLAEGLSEANRYVSSVTLNGRPLGQTVTYQDLMAGGELVFKMGDRSNARR